jgi:hypothetical protein
MTRHFPHVPFPPQEEEMPTPAAEAASRTVEPLSTSTSTSFGLNLTLCLICRKDETFNT